MKVLLNKCYGGFGFSPLAIKLYMEKKNKEIFFYIQSKYSFDKTTGGVTEYKRISLEEAKLSNLLIYTLTKDLGEFIEKFSNDDHLYLCGDKHIRTDKDMISVVEKIGTKNASGQHAELEIVNIPDDIEWDIDDYDGVETLRENHRSW